MSELRDAIEAAIEEEFRSHGLPARTKSFTDAVMAVLEEHTTEEWNVLELEDEVEPHYRSLYRERPMGRNLAEKLARNDPTTVVVSRRVSAWTPVEGED